ncbi:hypothetical protein [Neisseria elongata]|uniref:hypothetical protein n=1 Tax=Neisseria elongata TaxID=495 RepID=UPI001364AD59|nr:hypothetical protein [Neisseria elongata]
MGATPNWENGGYKPICAALQICLAIQRPSENRACDTETGFQTASNCGGRVYLSSSRL